VNSSPLQDAFSMHNSGPKKLHGRFLHITDMHPDPYYTPRTSLSTACHRKKSKKKKNKSLYFGTPYSECDSPLRLTNLTLDFLNDDWAPEIDFVIWTGDNARHDNDRKLPRTPSEIYDLNRAVAAKMRKVFSNRNIPVVPSLGNNDVWPHNILTPGNLIAVAPLFFPITLQALIVLLMNMHRYGVTSSHSNIFKSFNVEPTTPLK